MDLVRICELCIGIVGVEEFRHRNMGEDKVSKKKISFKDFLILL